MNLPAAILSVVLAAGAAVEISALGSSPRPDALAHELSLRSNADTARVVSLYTEALRRDSANPYRWTDLGEALAQDRKLPAARYCFQRALQLNRRLPQIWLRDANFHFGTGETDAALASAAQVLLTVPNYDGVLFNYFDQMIGDPAKVLAVIGQDRRAAAAYTAHLSATGQVDEARIAWQGIFKRGFADRPLAASYVGSLLRARRFAAAKADWMEFAGPPDDLPNDVFNGGFERDPTGSALDWRIAPSNLFETAIDDEISHSGKRSLRVRFLGTGNVSYGNVEESVIVLPGVHELRVWVRTSGITTNECPRLQIVDPESPARLDVRTEAFCGTREWAVVNKEFTVPAATSVVVVRVIRAPSEKFDNKIQGTLWVDAVRVVP